MLVFISSAADSSVYISLRMGVTDNSDGLHSIHNTHRSDIHFADMDDVCYSAPFWMTIIITVAFPDGYHHVAMVTDCHGNESVVR